MKKKRTKKRAVANAARPFAAHAFEQRVEFLGRQPTIFVEREAYDRMYHIVDIADEEVGWLGTVERLPEGDFLIKEVFLLKQEVSPSQTELSEEGIALLYQELISTHPDGVDAANELRFWGHSHVRMGTSPSGQDNSQMGQFQENGCPWFIRGILNKLGRMEFTIYLWEAGVVIVDAAWSVCLAVDDSVRSELEEEFKEKVSSRRYVAPYKGPERAHVHILPGMGMNDAHLIDDDFDGMDGMGFGVPHNWRGT
ncbi:MAG TPA: hypothetical protein VEB18_01855 [Candidatus Paceibacterota bacterium]|nr:hypothetical protein [Candidatus Paceibacterota bacterium]